MAATVCTCMYIKIHIPTVHTHTVHTHTYCTYTYCTYTFFSPQIIRALGLNISTLYRVNINIRVHDNNTIMSNACTVHTHTYCTYTYTYCTYTYTYTYIHIIYVQMHCTYLECSCYICEVSYPTTNDKDFTCNVRTCDNHVTMTGQSTQSALCNNYY